MKDQLYGSLLNQGILKIIQKRQTYEFVVILC